LEKQKELAMRINYVFALVAALASTPAFAQVVVTTPGNDAAGHQYQADQDRAAGRQAMHAAHENAAMGNYGAAAQDQAIARQDWHSAHHQEHAARRDSNGGVSIQLGQ
jgi:hypothetical protein